MYADVLVEYTNKAIDKTFTYKVPDSLLDDIKEGMKVKVPFNNKIINGFVVGLSDEYNDEYKLKDIREIVNKDIYLNKELMSVGKFLTEKTLCTKITAYQAMFPASLKIKNQNRNYEKYDTYLVSNITRDDIEIYIINNSRNKAQITILKDLLDNSKVLKNNYSSSAVKRLIELKLIYEIKEQKYRINHENNNDIKRPILNTEQQSVVDSVDLNTHNTYLLHGVTGSGKTEVYMALIDKVISMGKSAIMLVPEISLTAQMIKRIYERFNSVAIFHSGLSDGEKYDEYLKIYRDEVNIVVGTRSAIFAPLKNIGIIIIDEEQSSTYHQDTNPRYSALDVGEFRAIYNKCPLILGSATPTLESMARAKKGVYKLLSLKNRYNNSNLPSIKIVDMSIEMKNRHTIISRELENKIRDRLKRKEQVILLLNRRGYSTIVTCQNCGYTYKCIHCDITLTYHKSNNTMRCHYCGYTKMLDKVCPNCHEASLNYLGLGTERLEKYIKDTFENARVLRMDVDTTSKKGSHEAIINSFSNHEADILLGTQMISKGLDFPLVSLVGVISADASLNIPDFRSGERTFELLSQVAGRSGRRDILGEVVIQAYDIDNFYLKAVKNNSYEEFYKYEMDVRRKLKYPPYYYLVCLNIYSRKEDILNTESSKIYKYLKSNLLAGTIVFIPTPSSIYKVNNIYHMQILIKYRFDSYLIPTLKKLDELYAVNNNINLGIDFNPSRF